MRSGWSPAAARARRLEGPYPSQECPLDSLPLVHSPQRPQGIGSLGPRRVVWGRVTDSSFSAAVDSTLANALISWNVFVTPRSVLRARVLRSRVQSRGSRRCLLCTFPAGLTRGDPCLPCSRPAPEHGPRSRRATFFLHFCAISDFAVSNPPSQHRAGVCLVSQSVGRPRRPSRRRCERRLGFLQARARRLLVASSAFVNRQRAFQKMCLGCTGVAPLVKRLTLNFTISGS